MKIYATQLFPFCFCFFQKNCQTINPKKVCYATYIFTVVNLHHPNSSFAVFFEIYHQRYPTARTYIGGKG